MRTEFNSFYNDSMPDYVSYRRTVQGNLTSRVNLLLFIREFARIHGIQDAYALEFGVLNGESLIECLRILRGPVTRVYGFDSFEGLPDFDTHDSASAPLFDAFTPGLFGGQSRPDEVRRRVSEATGSDLSAITLYQGYYDQILVGFDWSQLTGFPLLVHLDCDLYSSTKVVLDALINIVLDGTWLLFDDFWAYRGSPLHGQQKALADWLTKNPQLGVNEYCNYGGTGKAFITYRK